MTRQSARHRRRRPYDLRLGASILIPALVASGTYLLLNDSPGPRTTSTGDPDLFSPPPVFTGVPTVTASDDPPPPSTSPTSSPTDDPTTTSTDSPEPTDESSPSPSDSNTPIDDPSSPDPDPTKSSDPAPDPTKNAPTNPGQTKKPKPPKKPHVELSSAEASMLSVINEDRADVGCSQVTPDASLMDAARAHSADMATAGHDSTEGSDGSSPQQRAYRAGYAGTVGEVAFDGIGWASLAMLINPLSRDQEAIITDCGYESIGIGSQEKGLRAYWTLDFGTS